MEPTALIKKAPGAVKAAVVDDQVKRKVTNRENVGHVVVEAHGADNVEHTKEQHTRKHEQLAPEVDKDGHPLRITKSSKVTLGRHVS